MTPPGKPTSAEVWDAVERAAREAELLRIDAMSDAAVDAELRAHGIAPEAAARVGTVSSLRWIKWLALAAGIALLLGALAVRREMQAWFEPPSIGKDHEPPSREPTPAERAATIRDDAFGACAQGEWKLCGARLDSARDLDPAGEADPRVRGARRAVASALEPWDGRAYDEKPHR